MYRQSQAEMRVVVFAPLGRDAPLLESALRSVGIEGKAVWDVEGLLKEFREGLGTAILSQEAIRGHLRALGQFLAEQPPWSDLPLIILTYAGRATYESQREAQELRELGNVTLIERPMRPETLQSAVRSALRARMRQYQVRQREQALQRANADLEQFAHSASHDLKEPIRGVGLYSELLAERLNGVLDEESRFFLGIIQSSAQRMNSLVNALLSYAHASSDGPEPNQVLAAVDARRPLEAALENLTASIQESGAQISISEMPRVAMRESHLAQVFQNLVGNAIKYRRQGTRPLIHVAAARENGRWQFSVADNGIGIPPQYQTTIFGIFKRLHTTSEYAGAGMGLAICHRIVERYGGRIWVESKEGEGSTFQFTVPAVEREFASA